MEKTQYTAPEATLLILQSECVLNKTSAEDYDSELGSW